MVMFFLDEVIFREIFEDEMLIRTLPTTYLQIFSRVSDGNIKRISEAHMG